MADLEGIEGALQDVMGEGLPVSPYSDESVLQAMGQGRPGIDVPLFT